MARWNTTSILKLLEIYEQYPALYNIKDKDYMNKLRRESMMEKMFEEVQTAELPVNSIEFLKKKIKSIRDTYRVELAKVIKSQEKTGSAPKDLYIPKLEWYLHADRFLGEHVATRKAASNFEITLDTVREMEIEDNSFIDPDNPPSPASSYCASSSTLSSTRKKRERQDSVESEQSIVKKYKPILNKIEAVKNEEKPKDACDIFGRYIAAQMRQLPKVRQILIQREMIEILTNHLLDDENCTSCGVHSTCHSTK